MVLATEVRKSVSDSTALYALVGAIDLAVEQARTVLANPEKVQADVQARMVKLQADLVKAQTDLQNLLVHFDPKQVQAGLQQVPALAVARALEAAGRAEVEYEELSVRGKVVVERLSQQKAFQDLLAQGKATVGLTKAAVSSAAKAADDTAVFVRATFARTAKDAGSTAKRSAATTRKPAVAKPAAAKPAAKPAAKTTTRKAPATRKPTATRKPRTPKAPVTPEPTAAE